MTLCRVDVDARGRSWLHGLGRSRRARGLALAAGACFGTLVLLRLLAPPIDRGIGTSQAIVDTVNRVFGRIAPRTSSGSRIRTNDTSIPRAGNTCSNNRRVPL